MSHLLQTPIRTHLRTVLASAASTYCKYDSDDLRLRAARIYARLDAFATMFMNDPG